MSSDSPNVESGSPAAVERVLDGFYESTISFVAGLFEPSAARRMALYILVVLSSLFALLTADDRLIDPQRSDSLFEVVYFHPQAFPLIFFVLIGGCFLTLMPMRFWSLFRVGLFVVVFAHYVASQDLVQILPETYILATLLPIISFFVFLTLFKAFRFRFLELNPYFALLVCFLIYYTVDSWSGPRFPWVIDMGRLLVVFVILTYEANRERVLPTWSEIHAVFQPFHFLAPVPLERQYRESVDQFRLRVKGLLDIWISLGFLYLAILIREAWLSGLQPRNGSWTFIQGFVNYLAFFLKSYAWIAIPVGLGRWLGLNLYDAFHWPLLSVTPHERWRRWNIYYYNWFYKTVFFPLLRLTRSPFVAVMAVFALTAMMHLFRFNYGWLFWDTRMQNHPYFSLRIPFFLGHGLIIYLSLQTAPLWPSASSRRGWIGVGIVTALMSALHVIAV